MKEHLNGKFKLNTQPEDGWISVPDRVDYHFTSQKQWKKVHPSLPKYCVQDAKIIWKCEGTTMNTEKKGRFLHQWAYDAFGCGEDLEFLTSKAYRNLNQDHNISVFNNPEFEFRIKPKTITIGTRIINAPINIKPNIGMVVFIPNLDRPSKFSCFAWGNTSDDNRLLDLSLCFITAEDAIAHTDALLALMQ